MINKHSFDFDSLDLDDNGVDKKTKKKYPKISNFMITDKINDDYDFKGLEKTFKDLSFIKNWAYIVHDKDRNEKGELKDKHIHIYCQVNNTQSVITIAKAFNMPPNAIEGIRDKSFFRACQYLIHLNDPNKYQYSLSEVKASFNFEDKVLKIMSEGAKKRIKANLIKDISEGYVKRYDLANYFQRNKIDPLYLTMWKPCIDNAYKVRNEYYNRSFDRDMEVIFITGKAGSGKTTFAKLLAKKKGYEIFVSGSSNDILDGYEDEECIILDDLRKESFSSFTDMLKLFDPFTNAKFKSRYSNKLVMADLIIITSTKPLEDLWFDESEDFEQLSRRITTRIEVKEDKIYIDNYDPKSKTIKHVASIANTIKELIKTNKKSEQVSSFTHDWFKENFG